MSVTAEQMPRPVASPGMYLPYIVPMLISTGSHDFNFYKFFSCGLGFYSLYGGTSYS